MSITKNAKTPLATAGFRRLAFDAAKDETDYRILTPRFRRNF
jgi:hypothetical protein